MNNIEEHLLKISEREGIVDAVIIHSPQIESGQGYLSKISVVVLKGQTRTGKNCKLNLFIKIAATNKKLREVTAVDQIFRSEIRMYESIFPAFYEFEKVRGITNPFPMVPKCYKTFGKSKPEILILENLKERGYCIWNENIQLNSEPVKSILSEYGKYHAVSFAMRDQNPDQFQQLTKNFNNNMAMFIKSEIFYIHVNKVKRLATLLNLQAESKIFRKFKEFLDKAEEKFYSLLTASDDFDAILHGDCWYNNILFKYKDKEHLQLSQICFIDFQLSRLASPVFDVLHFFYTCASKELYKNFQTYQRVYYDSFSQHLETLGSNADSLFPFPVFEEHWRKYATYGLFFSALANYAILTEENEVVTLEQILEEGVRMRDAFDYEIVNIDEYKCRMKAIVKHFIDNDLL